MIPPTGPFGSVQGAFQPKVRRNLSARVDNLVQPHGEIIVSIMISVFDRTDISHWRVIVLNLSKQASCKPS